MRWIAEEKPTHSEALMEEFPFEEYTPTHIILSLLTAIELGIANGEICETNYKAWFTPKREILNVLCRLPCKWNKWVDYIQNN